jgi:hypothetical protein
MLAVVGAAAALWPVEKPGQMAGPTLTAPRPEVGLSQALSVNSSAQEASQLILVPPPDVDLSDPEFAQYTLHDRATSDGPIKTLTLRVSKSVMASVGAVGLVKDGRIVSSSSKKTNSMPSFALVLIFKLANQDSAPFPERPIYQLAISNRIANNYTYKSLQDSGVKNCDVKKIDFGIYQSIDIKDDDYNQCYPAGGFLYLTDRFGKSEDVIICHPPLVDARICSHDFAFGNWNVSIAYNQDDLANWQDLKSTAIEYLENSIIRP